VLIVVAASILFRRYSVPPGDDRIERAMTRVAIGLILAGVFSVLNVHAWNLS
jgi:hypothetical protein